jgi:hypothetical protein
MSLFLASLPLWLSALLLVGVTTALAMLGPILVRRTVSLERLTTNNEVAGFKFAVLGVIYAVMMGFAVIVVWERFHTAEEAVTQEAGAMAALFRLSNGIEPEARTEIRGRIASYARTAIEEDWPAMSRASLSPAATVALSDLYVAVMAVPPASPRDIAVMAEMFHQLDSLTQSRRQRLTLASGILPPVLWLALTSGAVTTLGFTFFFGTTSLRAQTLMTGLLALTIFIGLFVVVVIDHPFTGPISVGTEPLEYVLRDLGGVR